MYIQVTGNFLFLFLVIIILFGILIIGFSSKTKVYSRQQLLQKTTETVCMAVSQQVASNPAGILTEDIKQSPCIVSHKLKFEQPGFNGRCFSNPASFTTWVDPPSLGHFRSLFWIISSWFMDRSNAKLPSKAVLDQILPVQFPTFDLQSTLSATWLGHATLFVHMHGISFITDPVWSACAAPFGRFFCSRYRPSPCTIDQLPALHFAIISHNHYDHLDVQAVRLLAKRFPNMRWFVPKGLKHWMQANTPQGTLVEELLWGQHITLSYQGQSFQIWCTPAQHWSQRGARDRNHTLWSSWAVIGPKYKFYFTGDSGFCPEIFQNIGDQLGPFDLSAIPIGCYTPRSLVYPQHMDPAEAVQVHQYIRAKKSIAIHWGTYAMGSMEPYLEPKIKLNAALQVEGLSVQDFFTLHHGETWRVEPAQKEDCT